MGAIKEEQMFQKSRFSSNEINQSRPCQWILSNVKNNVTGEYESDSDKECSGSDDSCDSLESLSSSEMVDDASSSSRDGPLYELSELMEQLPIKRGLSQYYQGKSESFGSLANLKNIKDLAKKGNPRSRMSIRSFGNGQSQTLSPKGIIVKTKKSSLSCIARSSLLSSLGEMSSLLDTFSVQNHF